MVPPVNQMKPPPLLPRERSQNRMIQKSAAPAELLFAARDQFIHLGNLRVDFPANLLRRQTPRPRHRWSFPSKRQIPESHHHQNPPALRPGHRSCGQRLARFHPLESLDGSRVSEIKMLENFVRAPFAGRMCAELLRRKFIDRRRDLFPQSLQRAHRRYSPFRRFQLECCATGSSQQNDRRTRRLKLIHRITGRTS